MAKFRVKPLGRNNIEVISPKVRYVLKTSKTSIQAQAFRNERLIEENSITRSGHDVIVMARDVGGSRARAVIKSTKTRTMTNIALGKEKFRVESDHIHHAPLLIRELKKRPLPKLKNIRLLANEIKANKQFRDEIGKNTKFNVVMRQQNSNGVIWKCVVACFLCALQSALQCLLCGACIEPILNPGPIIA